MWGAIVGDIAGSIYEYQQYNKVSPLVINELITQDGFYSDDTILTLAIYDAIRNDKDYEKYLRMYGERFINYVPDTNLKEHFPTTFGGGFVKWLKGENDGKSMGNGAMMRISGIGNMFDTEEEVIENARLATIPSHDTSSAIECATTIALVIFYARMGLNKEQIRQKIDVGSIEYKPFEVFNKTCNETIGNCLYAFFESVNFEDALRIVLSFGGDTDTNAAIVGSMAEAFYGIPEHLVNQARKKLPATMSFVIDDAYARKVRSAYIKER